ncbi:MULTISPECIES: primosomal replication protein N [Silvimonas]|uniref:primosomal replication protein N n=1 Tax=Silvimonas TaxID=300264 RepID=UPI0024B37754|nr:MULTISPECIES: primosomal replication protein N [Silvimonas]MDR3429086.1 primosomal replication protein N [Silvimonas sp.]
MTKSNRVLLNGTLIEMQALRITPAGIPILELVLLHESEQLENEMPRRVTLEAPARASGPTAQALSKLQIGQQVRVAGFLVSMGQKLRRRLVLHIEQYELLN